MSGSADAAAQGAGPALSGWTVFRRTPLRMQAYLAVVGLAALVLPWAVSAPVEVFHPAPLTVGALIGVSVLNVEVSRWLSGGLSHAQQPHKALSGWAFAAALLVPTWWLLVVVPVTYAHARWRGIRVPIWKWIGSGFYIVLCGVAAAWVRYWLFGSETNWMSGDGSTGLATAVVAAVAFLALETLLFTGSALLNHAEDEVWLRAMLTGTSFYVTESGVLLLGGLLSAVWTGAIWYTLLFIPLYVLIQHAVLLGPMRERAAVAVELAEKNDRLAASHTALESSHQFQIDLLGMLGHELGNPLTAVQGYAQVGAEAAQEGDIDTAREALAVVERNAVQMRAVLLDILTQVASERGGLSARPEECRLRPHLHAAVAALPRGRQPAVECAVELTALVQPNHLDQMLANLLSNAEKYADGAVSLTARVAGDQVEVVVGDHGPGVPAAFREKLFERGSREHGTSGTVHGAGLGLFISRELARANGGDLHHREATPQGAEFVVRLPAAVG